jgi:hypothetical protein
LKSVARHGLGIINGEIRYDPSSGYTVRCDICIGYSSLDQVVSAGLGARQLIKHIPESTIQSKLINTNLTFLCGSKAMINN